MAILILFQTDPGALGEIVKSVAVIGLAPTLLIVALWAYKNRTDATIKYLEDQNRQLLTEILRGKRS
ncbi:MAG: hypothetical protein H7Z16_04810 [Pyrinomonadaceae bacterium]|nr:hypothetical protein [Pyrinomonadaceae bacterium]